MPTKDAPKPALVEYLLRLVWDETEYAKLVKSEKSAVSSMKAAGLSAAQRTAVTEAVAGKPAKLKAAVAEECHESYGAGAKLWNCVDFIFGHHPPLRK